MIVKLIKKWSYSILERVIASIARKQIQQYVDTHIKEEIHIHMNELYNEMQLGKCLIFGNKSKVHIATTVVVNNALFNVSSGHIFLGDYVFFGHNVSILTGTHNYEKFNFQRQNTIPDSGRDVVIKQGAWIASNATVLGPCIIGEHAVVAAGSVVIKDVEPYSVVGGNPATLIKYINQ